ncbi:MAG: hypothetical protein KF857_05980 [Fimbriimonadaceae bacterium]|nr:hypothetical protein [Fimbriimonadaceae bacterium]
MGSPYAEYPRGPMGGDGGPLRGTPRGAVDLGAIGEAWELMKANWTPFVLATLIAGVAYYVVTLVVSLPFMATMMAVQTSTSDPTALLMAQLPMQLVTSLVGSLLMGVLMGGFGHMTIALLRGETVTVNHFFRVLPKAHLFMAFGFLYTLCTYIGLIGCIVGTFVVAGLLMIAPLFMVDKEMGPVDAIKASFNALKGEWLMAAVFYFVSALVAGIGAVACGVGLLFTVPLAMLAIALVYRDVVYVGVHNNVSAMMTSPGPAPTDDGPPTPPSGS